MLPLLRFLLLPVFLLFLASPSQAQHAGLVAHSEEGPGTAPPAVATPVVYHTAEEMPVFPGGAEGLQKFLRKELRYPDEALRRGVSGKVYVRFIITEEGRIRDAEIAKGLGAGLDEEALRLVRIMPWWSPGKIAGRPVWVAYTMPIIFRALE
ncbi:energy transducer TonB [Hymenobacter sp. HSC-4F20]|uniref:energy transducer TonB n=1 Tax=Hymenobacter sp. HSC-4F20 TaxID=2864135 RepID=UPI001C734E27|nr:energy transducer TonB [Hymenobacter sp. HSC-4F20]MBX0290508.1 energy transducer TonB [Hymenobacter sp. HSC-4F20]